MPAPDTGTADGGGPVPRDFVRAVSWKLNRLRCMSFPEIGHRVLRALAIRIECARGANVPRVPAADLTVRPRPWIHAGARVAAAPYLEAACRIAAGRLDVFAMRDVELGMPPRWNRDPKTGIEAPAGFGKLLDYRDAALVGDIKYLWELNRHLHLVTLAQAYALSGETRFAGVIEAHLTSWFAACPAGRGANWSSALEAAMRLINWSVTWQLIGGMESAVFAGAAGARFRHAWLESVYRHAAFVSGYFSRHSSANNHLIGEAAGLFVAALTWPCWPRAAKWRRVARDILEREVVAQNGPDGVNREQAVSYQQFELDLLIMARLAAAANGTHFSSVFDSRLVAMLEYLASIMDAGGNVPMIGDSDDGFVVRLAQDDGFCRYRSLLATGAVLYRRGDFKAKAGRLDDKTRWLVGPHADARFERLDTVNAILPVRRAFGDGGCYILGCRFEQADEMKVVADAGPLGYRAIAAHGHADALAFTLSVSGREFLIDPGTYAYHTEAPWRQYFRGTSAHNTVRIDGLDQSQSGGNFMWLKKARARCEQWESTDDEDVFQGSHDGYRRLADPVVHRRRIVLKKAERRLVVEDMLDAEATHEVELFFHCHEACRIEPGPRGFALHRDGITVAIDLPVLTGASVRVRRGSLAPILGWVSRRFDEKAPAPTIVWRARITGRQTLRTEIACRSASDLSRPDYPRRSRSMSRVKNRPLSSAVIRVP